MPNELWIEVAYVAADGRQALLRLKYRSGMTVKQAIDKSSILTQFPEIDLTQMQVGIFSSRVDLDYVLHAGERVEIYRPLASSPMQKRRSRASKDPSP